MCLGQPKLVPDRTQPSFFILTGNIGGTTSYLTLHEVGRDEITPSNGCVGIEVFHKEYLNLYYATFQDLLKTFFSQAPTRAQAIVPAAACFAIAGPVDGNAIAFTNRAGWVIDANELQKELQIPHIRLINDFVATGYGLLTLKSEETVTLQDAPDKVGAPIACVGAGLGLGECFLTSKDGVYDAWPSEGGHAEFAPRNELQSRLLDFLVAKFNQKNRVSVERIVSERGLLNVYEFLRKEFPDKASAALDLELKRAGDMGGCTVAANASRNELCKQAMDIMVEVYGAEVGVCALKWLPLGGLYITGNLASENVPLFTDSDIFMSAFLDKGRVSPVLKQVPVKIVLAQDVVQRGARLMAVRALQKWAVCVDNGFLVPSVGYAGAGPNVAVLRRLLTFTIDEEAGGQDESEEAEEGRPAQESADSQPFRALGPT